jgi:hypothetical protein
VLVVAGAVLVSLRTDVERRRGALLGGAAGLLFGLVAGLVKVVLTQARLGWTEVLTSSPRRSGWR